MRALLVLAVLLVGCGGPDPAFERTWSGTATFTFAGLNPYSYGATVRTGIVGGDVWVYNICPDGSQAIQTQDSGRSIQWSGALTCPPTAFADCASVVIRYTQATGTLTEGDGFSVSASGDGTGCSVSRGASISFVGH